MKVSLKTASLFFAIFLLTSVAILIMATLRSIEPLPDDLKTYIASADKTTYLDHRGKKLNTTYENRWNATDTIDIHEMPEFIQQAFILSEDKRFYQHSGIDWLARLNAIKQNLTSLEVVRGASTISEQVVRMIHPRPRTLWSRWIEGVEAMNLERQFSKVDILEFYLNQVPYRAKRRGIVQASRYYFNRDLDTLNKKEMMALAVFVRSPDRFDPYKNSDRVDHFVKDLGSRMIEAGLVKDYDYEIGNSKLVLASHESDYNAQHFIEYVGKNIPDDLLGSPVIHTTLDLEFQVQAQKILDGQLNRLSDHHVQNGAILIVDHESNEILAWVVGHAGDSDKSFNQFNAVLVRRQPGSALKPFLYANALNKGWTPATMLNDAPLQEGVGAGLHAYHNYSRDYYGLISLREALGNSLNVPAVKAIQFVGTSEFLNSLADFGIESLSGHPNVYGDGLALGNGELTLYELVQAYSVLARMGDFKALSFIQGHSANNRNYRVISEDIASLIADILSDPAAREKEFGADSILNFPYQTAVKTGTSSDYRDAWAVGFNDKYTVGVWMGNLDYSDMQEITGSIGPAMVLRSVFASLNSNRDVKPLFFSKNLVKKSVCIETGLAADSLCEARDEWFVAGTEPTGKYDERGMVKIIKPSNGLMLAMDPRIPDDKEYFEFSLSDSEGISKVTWYLNDQPVATTKGGTYQWKLSRGKYTASAAVYRKTSQTPLKTNFVEFIVN